MNFLINVSALIGTGFCSTSNEDHYKKVEFLSIWLKNVGERDVVIVENTDAMLGRELNPDELPGNVRVIRVNKNKGHVLDFLGKSEPQLCGWSLSWIQPALTAYAEDRDFLYQESDCLAFGNWEAQILSEMEAGNLKMAFGVGTVCASEQSLFYIRHDFILTAIQKYLAIPRSDGELLPEDKMWLMARLHRHIGTHSVGPGRSRPIDFEAKTFSAQKFTDEEMAELRARKMI